MSAQELTPPKRFITENNAEGKAVFSTQIPEELPARVIECGDKFFLGYTTNERPVDINGNKDVDTYSEYLTNEPGIVIPGGTVLRFVDIRPGGVSPMHRTVSLDYGVVVEGQVIIRLDSGESRLMQRGDVTIQRGTMHEWENASKTEWARMILRPSPSPSPQRMQGLIAPPGASSPLHFGDSRAYESLLDSSSESSDSFADSDLNHNPDPCPWRTTQFHDQECSLFFDCPSHLVERSLSVTGSIHTQPAHDDGAIADPDPASDDSSPNGQSAAVLSESTPGEDDIYSPQQSPNLEEIHSRALTAEIIDPDSPTQDIAGLADNTDLMNALPALPITPTEDEPASSSRSRVDAQSEQLDLHPSQTENHSRPRSEQERGTTSEWSVPRWQPDAEVTYCPICRAQFSFFVRKHHCRIIIPHQYIVRPPGSDVGIPQSLLLDGLGAGYFDINSIAGGERVRLCNPCVPDPNTAPPQSPGTPATMSPRSSHQRSRSSATGQYGTLPASNRHGTIFAPGTSTDQYQYLASRSRSITVGTQGSSSTHGSSSRRTRSGTHQTPIERLLSGGSSSSYPNRYSRHGEAASSSQQRALPPTPQIAEEDECPICHRELPSQSLPNSEALRESHITTCIQTHSTYGTPRSGDEAAAPPAAPRRTGMYTYPATEKDCIDDAECTICLEEFTVGIPMARLECLCRFHRSCISAWFVNHPGRCPVHQHDGFGY
ncbi:hypothetical protein BKA56DRAFT_626863 [Ilyonectria sp. MPI-CAGE-AT-0026]|nr:hypothetical protein BKA56DRAFT_626863 [Ilyonectria sp. MPI-CAGE-AT-0026]